MSTKAVNGFIFSCEGLQRATFEASAPLGPVWASLASGYAVVICGVLHLTEAGERYLATIERDNCVLIQTKGKLLP